ncbi:MAG: hypothetical protein AVDCRST_MAG74-3630 [uncultured Pyrinomonadaceae bacterium]|uniref:DUF362 domain-containing protein n=1 Tax=uncultured Pyrinomonadaceae bacterium TaxID=2283094 RepID=A0A6J4Q1A4_9BACT|nr:MAG: hypothetical protein AVDCRST_MAG74-3630 [uncultured Pyrinomonadaceae bacterium]
MENTKKSVVAIAHTREKHRSPERVLSLVRAAIDLLGGMETFVKPHQIVLIKPNQTVFIRRKKAARPTRSSSARLFASPKKRAQKPCRSPNLRADFSRRSDV